MQLHFDLSSTYQFFRCCLNPFNMASELISWRFFVSAHLFRIIRVSSCLFWLKVNNRNSHEINPFKTSPTV